MISGGLSGADIGGASSPSCDLCTPFFKTMVWLAASLISVAAIFLLGPVAGAVFTILMPFATTAFLKLLCKAYTVSAKDVLLYVCSVIGWTVAGAGVIAVIEAGIAASILGITIMALMLIPVILADLVMILANNRYRRIYKCA